MTLFVCTAWATQIFFEANPHLSGHWGGVSNANESWLFTECGTGFWDNYASGRKSECGMLFGRPWPVPFAGESRWQ